MEVLMKICWYLIGLSALPALLASCAPLPELIEPFAGDVHPPVLLGVQATASREVRIQFDETARVRDGEITVDPPRALVSGTTEETTVVLTFNEDLEPGTLFWIDGAVADQQGNITSFLVNVYGRNERPPSLVVNEFVCEGSTTHPDVVELRVLSAGNLAGLSLLDGSPGTYDDAIVLPALEVAVDANSVLVRSGPAPREGSVVGSMVAPKESRLETVVRVNLYVPDGVDGGDLRTPASETGRGTMAKPL